MTSPAPLLRVVAASSVSRLTNGGLDPATLDGARALIAEVRSGADGGASGAGLRAVAERLGDLQPGQEYLLGRDALERAYNGLEEVRALPRARAPACRPR